jgi:hypothetical protein
MSWHVAASQPQGWTISERMGEQRIHLERKLQIRFKMGVEIFIFDDEN